MKVEPTLKNFRNFQRKCMEERKKHPIAIVVANGACTQTAAWKEWGGHLRSNWMSIDLTTLCCLRRPLAAVCVHPNRMRWYDLVAMKLQYSTWIWSPKDVKRIVTETIIRKKILDDLLYKDPVTGRRPLYREDTIFFGRQKKVFLERAPLK